MLEFKLPEVGENITTGTVVNVLVKEGDSVTKDQALLELETDKATLEVPSPANGKIAKVLISAGQEINIGQAVMHIEEGGDTSETPEAPAKESKPAEEQPSETESKQSKKTEPKQKSEPEPKPANAPAPNAPSSSAPAANVPAQKDVPASPTVRRFAREIGVDLSRVNGSGPGGRISKDDVKTFAKGVLSGASAGSAVAETRPLPDFAKWGDIERVAMNNIRKKTAQHLSYCWSSIPHVTQFDKADITDLEKLRKQYAKPDRKLTITPFLIKVIASALKTFPQFNASVDMASNSLIYKKYINVGVAVDTENGLLVPVIRDADKKNIIELNTEIMQLAEKARTKKLTLDEMQGGSFTITNLGGIGGTSFTPIVNWPEVAILGVSRGRMEPNYNGQHCYPSLMLPLSLSYDHRIIDGADGARFLKWITEAIEQPFMMEMEG